MNGESINCSWKEHSRHGTTHCVHLAKECVIAGCLDGHIREYAWCAYHYNEWCKTPPQDTICPTTYCENRIDDWMHVPINYLTPGFALHMKAKG